MMLLAGGRAGDARERTRARELLVVGQVALAVILLVASGLMVRTFLALRAVPPGFTDPGHVQLVRIAMSETQVREAERVLPLQRAMLDRLAAIPGVRLCLACQDAKDREMKHNAGYNRRGSKDSQLR